MISQTTTDFELLEAESYAQASLAEHLEMDCEGGGEFECPTCNANRQIITEARTEQERRIAVGMSVPDPRVGLEALAAWGTEWELEQAERFNS